ncbi:hypothetical protein F5B17DRAFT_84235 [Nemania serpens]|nr:hypothetical protein F5B17DRAFT_84235 [Nemania serpens]
MPTRYPYAYPHHQPQTIPPSSPSRIRTSDSLPRCRAPNIQSRPPTQSKPHAQVSSAQGSQTPPPQRQIRGTTSQRPPHLASHEAHSPRSSDAQPQPPRSHSHPHPHSQSHRAGASSLRDSKQGQSAQTQTQTQPQTHTPGHHTLQTRDILKNPRLQQITGLRPGRVNLAGVAELPPEELSRLAWAMALPEPFPFKRPRGDRGSLFSSPRLINKLIGERFT